jgi:geranylgeranyl diphosphate synthase type II
MRKIENYLKIKRRLIEANLNTYLPLSSAYPPSIHQAMRYSLFSAGKRLRPVLVLAAAEAGEGNLKAALPTACAIEMIHTFSLIHDDLPALDNDDFRRGKPACHRRFGEDTAILAGDALLVLGFNLLGESERIGRRFLKPGLLVKEMAEAIGTAGLIGGQVVDLISRKRVIGRKELAYIYEHKTAALITASLRLGGFIGRVSACELKSLSRFGQAMGFAFQLVDDLLDETSDKGASYVKLLGKEKTRAMLKELTLKAEEALAPLGERADILKAINQLMVHRLK